MTTMTETSGLTLNDVLTSLPRTVRSAPDWLVDRRCRAADTFLEMGMPTLRDEEWRQTSLKSLQSLAFTIDTAATEADLHAVLDLAAIQGLDCPRAVYVNGEFSESLSNLDDVDGGLTFLPLSEALARNGDLLEQHLGVTSQSIPDAFASLNMAMADDVAVILVNRNAAVAAPLYVLNVTVASSEPIVTNPRMLIVAEQGAEATIIEDHVGLNGQIYFTNAVTEVFVGPNANVTHYFLERESVDAINVSTLRIRQQRDSQFISHSVLLGGAVVRNNVNPVLDGEGCLSTLNGVYLPTETQHHDNHMHVEHRQPHCESRQYYKGLLKDRSTGVFSGRIVVSRDAQKTDAIQSNQNLLLSPDARAHMKPQLEIYADDVRCTHGATIGELDEQAIFYLRSRGMSEDAARSMLIYAFASESLERMNFEPMRSYMRQILIERLPEGRVLEGMD